MRGRSETTRSRASGARATGGLLALAATLALLGALTLAPSAQAEFEFCPFGEAAGQCGGAHGIAADIETGRVYIADTHNRRVNVFEQDGAFVMAFGWGVDTGAQKLETCSAESGCQKGIAGGEAGQLSSPRSIAVDNVEGSEARHDVYILDLNYRVSRFESDGSFVNAFGWGVDTGAEEFETCTAETGCQAGIDALVTGEEGKPLGECQIGRYVDPIAIGPEGNVFVGDHDDLDGDVDAATRRIEKLSPEGECLGETALFEPAEKNAPRINSLAVDAEENAYVGGALGMGLRKYDLGADETELCQFPAQTNLAGIDLDAEGRLFAFEGEGKATFGGTHWVITEYDTASCEAVRRFGYGKLVVSRRDIAVLHRAAGDVFVSGVFSPGPGDILAQYVKIPPPGPIVVPSSLETDPVANVRATVKAEVNPEGKATEVHFEYLTQAAYLEQGESFEGAATESTEPVPLEVPEGREFNVNAAEALLGCPEASKELIEEGVCLTPETKYRYRLIATNEDNPSGGGDGTVEGEPFTTKEPLEIEEVFATDVGTDAATLHARVDPLGIPATGWFEYLTAAQYEANLEAEEDPFAGAGRAPAEPGELDFGSGEERTERTAALYPLKEGTAYRYRLVATNALIDGALQSKPGSFTSFRSAPSESCPANEGFRTGLSAPLPDCRAYEMVSPPDKGGGDIVGALSSTVDRTRSAISGERLSYGTYRAFGDASSAPLTSMYIAARDPEAGWLTHAISPPHDRSIRGSASLAAEFKAFSEDLCDAWLMPTHEPALAAGATPGFFNLYRRTDELCGGESYEALTTLAPENADPVRYRLEVQGLTADRSIAAFAANDILEGSGAPPQPECGSGCGPRLYLKAAAGPPIYPCVLPDVAPATLCSAGTPPPVLPFASQANLTNALAADGSGIYWTDGPGEGPLYLRANPFEPESPRASGAARGAGDLTGPARGLGNLSKFLFTIGGVQPVEGSFAVGQEISGEFILPGTTITQIEETSEGVFKLTVSQKPTESKPGGLIEAAGLSEVANVVAASGEFAPGQEISGPGIPAGTTVEAIGEGTLTLSAVPTEGKEGAQLSATSPCDEPEAKACTFAVSAAAEAAEGSDKTRFWAAAADGSAAIFTVGPQGNGALYEYDADAEASHKLAGGVTGVLGAAEDLSRVYFTSKEVLSGEEANGHGDKAQAGEANLYLYGPGAGESGPYRFIATLAAADARHFTSERGFGTSAVAIEPRDRNGRVSPSGAHAAFMSTASLTGYDNTDVLSGEADSEVFLYDAEAGELRCVSCNPSGARPVGLLESGNVPVGGLARIPVHRDSLYPGRVLAEDGARLYFESLEALVPRDTNGRIDVYQWEEPGTGSCGEEDPTYSDLSAGCVDLISSGRGQRDAEFLDADPAGENVFFSTLSSLLPRQDSGQVDVYVARVEGGFPAPPSPAAECEGEACQSPVGAPEDSSPASAAYRGAGNLARGAGIAGANRCRAAARKARRSSHRAKRYRAAARRAKAPAQRRRLNRVARRRANGARRLARNAKRCRARIRKSGRAGR